MVNLKLKQISQANNLLLQVLKENKQHKATYFALGLVEFSRGQYEKSMNYLQSGMDIDSILDKSLEAQGFETMSEIYLMRGDKSKALEMANLDIKKNPSRSQAQELCTRLGGCDKSYKDTAKPDEELLFNCQLFLRQKEYVHAQAECKSAFEINPKNYKAALKAGEALWSLGQGLEAIDWINKAIKVNPRDIKAYLKKAEFLSQRYDFSEAERTLFQADYLSRSNYEVQRGYANLALKKKDYKGAMRLAERALKLYDADLESVIIYSSAARELTMATRVANQKEQEAKQKVSQEAYDYAVKALELDSTSVEAQINYAKVLATRQGVDSGADYLQELIRKYPTIYEYRLALAKIFMEETRFKQAADVVEKVLSLNENNKKAHMMMGSCLNQLGQVQNAVGEFLKASYLDPSDAEPIFEVAKVYLETSRLNEAKEQFERVIRLNPMFPRAHLFLGKTYLLNGNFNEAEKNAEIEKKMYPGLIDSYLLVGEIKYASKNYSDCAAEYARASNTGNQPVYVYVRAARCYRLAGQIDMAQGFLDIAAERESG
ncbi:MAG: tetratricopeptide repeat protein, partial [Bdellovibrionales bacterium]|nr:tetratricopeptide repeat protein [Bdellovibrionales bacterium]